jgi:hypothetical protein
MSGGVADNASLGEDVPVKSGGAHTWRREFLPTIGGKKIRGTINISECMVGNKCILSPICLKISL